MCNALPHSRILYHRSVIAMCGIFGYINHKKNFHKDEKENEKLALAISSKLTHGANDCSGVWVGERAVFAYWYPAAEDGCHTNQPMKRMSEGYEFIIVYNGELDNMTELGDKLKKFGYRFTTDSDAEILLYSYIHYGTDCLKKLSGVFSLAIYDSMRRCVVLARDRLGAKPLYYCTLGDTIIFSSERAALFEYPDMKDEENTVTSVKPAHFVSIRHGNAVMMAY